jgi:hypothetical protein
MSVMPNSKKFPCRCLTRINGVKCTGRRSLRMKPEHYTIQPKCASCGKRHWYIDKYRMRKEMGRGPSCMCGGLHFPHRKGTKFCYSHPNAEADHTDRYGGSNETCIVEYF